MGCQSESGSLLHSLSPSAIPQKCTCSAKNQTKATTQIVTRVHKLCTKFTTTAYRVRRLHTRALSWAAECSKGRSPSVQAPCSVCVCVCVCVHTPMRVYTHPAPSVQAPCSVAYDASYVCTHAHACVHTWATASLSPCTHTMRSLYVMFLYLCVH